MREAGSIDDIRIEFSVVDENGLAIKGAKIHVGFRDMSKNKSATQIGFTNDKGEVTLVGTPEYAPRAMVSKEGFYETRINFIETFLSPPAVKETRYLESQIVDVVLKTIWNPIPLCAKKYESGLPSVNERYGYDMEKGDWVGPYGSGSTVDFYLEVVTDDPSFNEDDWDTNITFPNDGDGIVSFESEGNLRSALRSDYLAPVDGYLKEWVYSRRREPGKRIVTNSTDTRCYYLRVRTKLDEEGNIVSANYAKIYGEVDKFMFIFNPEANDRNLEFDFKKNILRSSSRHTNVPFP